jgi:hypothetical protein
MLISKNNLRSLFMKKFNLLKIAAFATLVFGLNSCSDQFVDEIADAKGNGAAKPVKTIGNGVEVLIANQTVNFDSDTIYLLDGFVRFRQNSVLNIEAGTVIKGTEGATPGTTAGTLVIERTAKINAIGTPASPIVFTSAKPAGSRLPGDWGGVVIAGRAYANVKVGTAGSTQNYEGNVEGVPAGVNPIRYGSINSDPNFNYNDDSGILQYVRIEFAGNVLGEGNETNGLTLCAVGAGTTIDHVQVSFGADDAFEWFGGTVDQKYLISYRNKDDDFDADQGYYGRTQFGFILRDPALKGTGSGGSRAFECNGDDDTSVNLAEEVQAEPAYSNITAVGPMGSTVGTGCNTNWTAYTEYAEGAVIRDNAQMDLANSVIAGFPRRAINLEDPTDYIAGGTASCDVLRNRFVYTQVVDATTTATNVPDATAQVNNELRKVTGCDNPAIDQAGKSGLKRAAWRLPSLGTDPVPDFTIASTSPLAGNTNPEKPKFTSTRFVNFGGLPYRGVQDNNAFWDKTVQFRGAAGTTSGNWGTTWMNYTPNVPAYD